MNGEITHIIYYLPEKSEDYIHRGLDIAHNALIDDIIYCIDSAMTKEELIKELIESKRLH